MTKPPKSSNDQRLSAKAQTVASVIPSAAPALGHVPDQLLEERIRPDLDLIAWAAKRRP